MNPTVTVDAGALRQILEALVGPSHLIRELQVLAESQVFGSDSPIRKLIGEYNDQRCTVGHGAFPERDPSIPAEQQGLFEKFRVQRLDGSDCDGGKHYGCRYFVLDLNHDQHAPAALRAYAESCVTTHPQLAADLHAEFGKAPTADACDLFDLDVLADACMEAEISDSKYESLCIALRTRAPASAGGHE